MSQKSLQPMAKDFKSSHRTIKRILNIDLNKKCYRKITVQSLKEDQKPIRKTCCQWIRKNIDRSKLEKMMFADEKTFDLMPMSAVDFIQWKNIQCAS